MRSLRETESGATLEGWPIPEPDEAPPEAMVDWLHAFPHDQWEGDPDGLYIFHSEPDDVIEDVTHIPPGDWVVKRPNGKLGRVTKEEVASGKYAEVK